VTAHRQNVAAQHLLGCFAMTLQNKRLQPKSMAMRC